MFCKNCGNEMLDTAAVCVKCGVGVGQGAGFCHQCGVSVAPNATFCTNCGVALTSKKSVPAGDAQKSKLTAGLLGIFLGGLGIHNFYLGFNSRALIQLLVSLIGGLLTCGIASFAMSIWGLVEGIMILVKDDKTDANGIPLK
ncbi:MAG: zinc ribbon domain-containing protein [Ruminococcaceae bacterium]|nr:zinc ribbon domain-containing protein [Oscillospiraceae bacterium]